MLNSKTFLFTFLVTLFLVSCGTDQGDSSAQSSSSSSTDEEPIFSCQDTDEAPLKHFDWQLVQGYTEMEDTHGVKRYELSSVQWPNFDYRASLEAFQQTVYPQLQSLGCVDCHASSTRDIAPLIADCLDETAHRSTLTKINFYQPENSKLIEKLSIERHFCPGDSCSNDATHLLTSVILWLETLKPMQPTIPRVVEQSVQISDSDIEEWIEKDRSLYPLDEQPYIVYTTLHELHNDGASAYQLNLARVALSKALNSTARWAPEIFSPVDINGDGIVYRFDIRDYWGYNRGVKRLFFSGGDPDNPFGQPQMDYQGNTVPGGHDNERYDLSGPITKNDEHALLVWERVLHGNVEGKIPTGTLPPNIDGFKGETLGNASGLYVDINQFKWVELTQLVYTLTRPDVYNALLINPYFADELEEQLEVDSSSGVDSYDYALVKDSAAIDSRMFWRAKRPNNGWYWKTWNVRTGILASGPERNIHEIYADPLGFDIRYPFWANPIPVFVNNKSVNDTPLNFSFIATLGQTFDTENPEKYGFLTPDTPGCDAQPLTIPFSLCRHFTGTGGMQQSESEVIYNLPNGLHGYYMSGPSNERVIHSLTDVSRDPRRLKFANDDMEYMTGTGYTIQTDSLQSGTAVNNRYNDPRQIVGSSCISCHDAGLKRFRNDLRDGLDGDRSILPTGPYGVDPWLDDPDTVARVRQLYKPSGYWSEIVEQGRKQYLEAMSKIRHDMVMGEDKNTYMEPVTWAVEEAQKRYKYTVSTSN